MELVLLLSILPAIILARIEPDEIPTLLNECYSKNFPYTLNEQNNCLGSYLTQIYGNISRIGLHESAVNWIDSLGKDLHRRLKRQTESKGRSRLRVRQEIRTLSDAKIKEYFDAVNALKRDTSVKPNKYDAFALTHQGLAVPSAHGGPNFLGWHRYLLVLFEDALRTKKRRVTIPYWDSSLDFRMRRPENTVIFTELFVGNGKGVVYNGPFAYWMTPAGTLLRRNVPGVRSSLIDPNKIKNVFAKRYHREILTPTAANDEDNLERHHDAVHRWVGAPDGHMADLFLSTQDPVFFLLHCHIDYLWEIFRERQKKLGIDSSKDYPNSGVQYHEPNRIMDNLKPDKKNIDGYSNHFTSEIYRYEDSPTCGKGCRGKYLYCNRKRQCVSRSRKYIDDDDYDKKKDKYASIGDTADLPPVDSTGSAPSGAAPSMEQILLQAPDNATASRAAPPTITQLFREGIVDTRTPNARKRRSVTIDMEGNKVNIGLDISLSLPRGDHSYRPMEIKDNFVRAPVIIETIYDRIQADKNYISDLTTKDTNYTIKLDTFGLTYQGHFGDTISVDGRTKSSESVITMAFDRPSTDPTKAYVRVYDNHGNICQPSCLISGSVYQQCSGALKITLDHPLMYYDRSGMDDGSSITPFLKFLCVQ